MTSTIKRSVIVGAILLLIILASSFFIRWYGLKGEQGPPPYPTSVIISYAENGFNPTSTTIQAPALVTFQNNQAQPFDPISRELGDRCSKYHIDNTFYGSCHPIMQGDLWSVEFQVGGAWDYYDALNPVHHMIINVRPGNYPGIPQ